MRNLNLAKMLAFFLLLVFNKNPAKAQSFVPGDDESGVFKIHNKVDFTAYSFDLRDVRLLNSPFKEAMTTGMSYLLELKPDRFLAHFRTHAGLKAKDSVYGGWESSGLAGHSLGHYLSACSMAYAATGNQEFLERVNYMVDQLSICQKARGTGYVGAIPDEDTLFAQVSRGIIKSGGFDLNGGWSPWYTVHKIMAGLLDAYIYCDNRTALKVDVGMADWTGNIVKNLNHQQMQQMLECEYGGMNEVLANIYAATGNRKYLDLAYRFFDDRFLGALAKREEVIAGKHANTEIPKILGCARIYELTGDTSMNTIADFFWHRVIDNFTYAPGGVGNYEYFGVPDQFPLSNNNMETCPSYNLLKLTGHLFTLHPSSYLMDYYEKDLYNHILATQNHQTGMTVYFTPLRMGGTKEYSTPFNTFTCCVGTSMENQVKYGKDIYFHGRDGSLFVNLFIPSVLNWKEKGIAVRQESNIPQGENVSLTINASKPQSLKIRIRKPYWAYKGMVVKVNGELQKNVMDEYGYVVIDRVWKNKDSVSITIPMRVHKSTMPEDKNRIALFYGPELLAGDFGKKEPDPVNGVPVFVTKDTADVNDWVKQVSDKNDLVFTPSSVSRKIGEDVHPAVKLIPFNETEDQYYTVYWDLFTPNEWTLKEKEYQEVRKQQEELDAHTVDYFRLGEMQPERDHSFAGNESYSGEDHTQKWRATEPGGSFSFRMKVNAEKENQLMCTYWGMDNRGRIFDIYVNGEKIATVDLTKYMESKFYHIKYDIPFDLTKGKTEVDLTFKPINKDNMVGPIYGVRTLF